METGKLFIGPRLRALRLERGLTQTDFARLLGVSGSLVNLLERNQRSASLAVLWMMPPPRPPRCIQASPAPSMWAIQSITCTGKRLPALAPFRRVPDNVNEYAVNI